MSHVVVVTGMSGAGRSTALHVLEDLGFYCVDNIPPALASSLLELAESSDRSEKERVERLGLGVDVRTVAFLEGAGSTIEGLREAGHELDVLFLDATDEVLIRRYSETRRPHPLALGGDVQAAIALERERLAGLRAIANRTIDTSELTVHDLKRVLVDELARGGDGRQMVVRFVSFGFKYGLPIDADLVFDLRFLPNPHFVPELRPKTGREKDVSDYVLQRPETEELLADLGQFFEHTLPRYQQEGKAYLTVAIGCTGGRHRSVAVSEELVKRLRGDWEVALHHRDADRKKSR
ncbi:MAG: RNase adapter RapZ [Deltaproteobacteria bacterium]|nr:RNase adapter RapZ [Deltaproteobacteria bacterium]